MPDNAVLAVRLDADAGLLDDGKTRAQLMERIERLTTADGTRDGKIVDDRSRESSPRPAAPPLRAAFGDLALVSTYGEYAQAHSLRLPDGGADYLTAFYDVVHDLVELVDWLRTDVHVERWMIKAYANGLLELSDPDLHPVLGDDAMPNQVWDAIEDVPTPGGKGGRGFLRVGALMEYATARPDLVVATELTVSTGRVAELIRTEIADAGEVDTTIARYAGTMQHLVEVASRNEEANELLLTIDDRDHLDGRQALMNLYTFPWPDRGKAVAGYTDWIANARNSDDDHRRYLAERANAGLTDYLTEMATRHLR